MSIHRMSMIIISAAFTVLAACGGGGSDAPNTPAQQAPPAQVTANLPITAGNAEVITEIVLDAITSSREIVSLADVVGLPFAGIANQGPANALTAQLFTETTACTTGEVVSTWNDADDSLTISTGDSFEVLFNACFLEDLEATLSGASSFSNMVITGDSVAEIAPWSLETTFGFDDLSVMDSDDTVIIDGALDIASSSADNVTIESSIAIASLTVQDSGESETLSDFVLSETVDLNAMTQVLSSGGIFTSTELEGSVTFETLEDFLVIGDDNPSAGTLFISDSSSSVLLTVIDNMNVRLEIDLDLDGTIDTTLVLPWSEVDVG